MYKPLNKGIISKRTGKNTVALVGFSTSTRHLVPYDDKDTEIWGINDAYSVPNFMKRWDRWFQLHPLDYLSTADGTPRDQQHIEWLKKEHNFPIYMQKEFEDMPASVKYPLDEVCEKIGRRYITSSFGFLFGLAWLEGFQRIEIYGFDMKTFSEYAHQRPNSEYMIGKAEGQGVDVYIPLNSSLCKGAMYAYEDLDISYRQEVEYRLRGIEAVLENQKNAFYRQDGKVATLNKLRKIYPKLQKAYKKASNKQAVQTAQLNNTMGRKQEMEESIALYDDMKAKELKQQEIINGKN